MNKSKLFVACLALLALISIPFLGKASLTGTTSQATLSVSPATGSYNISDTFTVSIYMNTNGQNVVVSAAYLNYDRNSFQAVSIDTTGSVFTVETEKIIDSTNGIIKITRGIPTPGVNTASGLVAKINFKALYGATPSSDNLTFRFAAGDSTQSTVIKNDGLGTNILSGVYGGKYTVSGQANPSPSPTPAPSPTPSPTPGTDVTPPAKVTNVVSSPAETQALITWKNPADGDYSKTKIVRKEFSYPASPADGIVVFNDNKNSFTDTSLKSGTTYYYAIYAYDTANNYSQASQFTVTTNGTPGSSSQIYLDGTLLKTSVSPKVYVIIDQKRKWISTPEVFETLGYKWTSITNITADTLQTIPDYEDNLIRAINDYKVYLVVNGLRRHIPNPEIFLDYGFAWTDVKDVPQDNLDQYPSALLVRESKQNNIYYISPQGVKKWIRTPEIFNSYSQNKWDQVQVISGKEMSSYPAANLIRLSGSDNVYLIENNTKRLIPTAQVFDKYHYDWNKIMNVNQVEFNYFKEGIKVS